MLIKGIKHNVVNDAPFIGALIIAPRCLKDCPGCQNAHLKQEPDIEVTSDEIIEEVKSNFFNEGIILGGLEWTHSPKELRELVGKALSSNLEVMLYTYRTEENFKDVFPDLYSLPIWVKFGEYDKNKTVKGNIHYGITLATSNQYIKKLG